MTLHSPVFLQSGSYTADDMRRAFQSQLPPGYYANRGGAVSSGDCAITAVSGLTVQVAPGELWIPGTEGGATAGMPSGLYSDGAYYCYQDATLNLSCAAANPTNPRLDLVVAVVNNAEYTSPGYGTSNSWTPAIVTGTPAATPVAPSSPGNSVPLATVLVPAGSSTASTITDLRKFINQPAGGRVYYTGSGTMTTNSWTTISTPILDFVQGGVTQGSSGLVVSVAGRYHVDGHIKASVPSGTGILQAGIFANGSLIREGSGCSGATLYPAASIADTLYLPAGTVINLAYLVTAAATVQSDGASLANYLSLAFFSS